MTGQHLDNATRRLVLDERIVRRAHQARARAGDRSAEQVQGRAAVRADELIVVGKAPLGVVRILRPRKSTKDACGVKLAAKSRASCRLKSAISFSASISMPSRLFPMSLPCACTAVACPRVGRVGTSLDNLDDWDRVAEAGLRITSARIVVPKFDYRPTILRTTIPPGDYTARGLRQRIPHHL
ncbi:hypothetical protein AB0F91_34565 [Amycolatopsis sp. NPDC023774]|uniref:hypothetical protein n=1 Tax=Amycolatopsis sp. NPDC023774 TaxID=3155015 RepID=UPI0033FEAD6E